MIEFCSLTSQLWKEFLRIYSILSFIFFSLEFTFCTVNTVICNEYYKYREQKLFKDSKKIYDNIN